MAWIYPLWQVPTLVGTFRPQAFYMLKLLPQPQVVFAFGLRITNWAPVRLSV